MRLNKEEVDYIDNYLKFLNIKFLDVKIELIDHLASQYENIEEDISLENFLRTKKDFVRNFEKKLHTKRHWGYQKALINRVLKFFYKPKYLLITAVAAFVFFQLAHLESSLPKGLLFMATLIVPQAIQFYIYYKPKGLYKKIQSFQYIFSIMSGPSVFLYFFNLISEWLIANPIYFTLYWLLAFVFNISGIIEIIAYKKRILSTYNQIINS